MPSAVGVIVLYAATLLLPGALLGALAGLRGWTLAATAPLLTYALAGLAAPLATAVGVGWSAATFAITTILVGAVGLAVRLAMRRRWPPPERPPTGPDWSTTAHAGVAVAVLVALGFGIAAVLGGIGSLSAIPQDWDAVYHAAGIRYIAETGDGGVFGMSQTNWFEGNVHLYYPNAYHVVAAAVYQMSGAAVPTVLNAHTVLIPGMTALTLVALVHRFGGRPVLAAATALAIVATTALYDLFWRGPLLPFAAGVALTPIAAVLVRELLDDRRLRLGPAAALAGALAGYMPCTRRSWSARSCSSCRCWSSAGGAGGPCGSWGRWSRSGSSPGPSAASRWRARSPRAATPRSSIDPPKPGSPRPSASW